MKRYLLFLCLALSSLACLTTTEPFVTYPADTPTSESLVRSAGQDPEQETPAAELTKTPTPSSCAVISADEALHLRKYADPRSQVLAYMQGGEVVRLISRANADWWLIKRDGQTGFARSKYLEIGGCDENP